jgi:uncharacterized protein (TIGR02466 family)
MAFQSLFTTEIFYGQIMAAGRNSASKIKSLNRELIRESYIFCDIDHAGQDWSSKNYSNGYTSYSSITNLPERSPHFAELKTLIDQWAKKFVKKQAWDLQGGKVEMTTCWVNIMGTGCQHSFHLHPHSVISGTYYLQTPKGSGGFKIEDPRIQSLMAAPPKKGVSKNSTYQTIVPEAGSLVLFESWLKHEVTKNESNQERISVSFNYDWIR